MAKKKVPRTQKTKFKSTRKEVQRYRELARKSNSMRRYLGDQFFGRRSIRVDKFETRKEFLFEMRRLERRVNMGTKGYRLWRNEIFKQNYITHLRRTYGSIAEQYARKLEQINANEFYNTYKTNKIPEIYALYYGDDAKFDPEFWEKVSAQLSEAFNI